MTDILDRETEEVLDVIRQHCFKARRDADGAIDALKMRNAELTAEVERLWACLRRIVEGEGLKWGPIFDALDNRDLSALERALGVKHG